MKLSRTNQVVLSISAGVVSLCAGTLLTSNFKNAGQTITLATLLSLPTVAGLHLVLDGKATKRINEAEAKASNAESRASQAEFKAIEATATLSQTQSRLTELSKKNSELSSELASVRASLEDVSLHRHQLIVYAEKVQPTINQLQQELRTAQETVEALQAEIEELETDFEEKVEAEAEARFQEAKREEIQRIFDEHDVVRLLYLAAWLLPLWVIFPGLQQVHWAITWEKAISFFVGVEFSALNHLLLDGLLLPLPSSVKARLKGN